MLVSERLTIHRRRAAIGRYVHYCIGASKCSRQVQPPSAAAKCSRQVQPPSAAAKCSRQVQVCASLHVLSTRAATCSVVVTIEDVVGRQVDTSPID